MSKVELSLSETFHKHKRNLILLCSAVIVLWLASPSKLKPPFVGAEVDLPSRTAFILLALALIYMFVQYFIEYRTMLARNSSRFAGESVKTVDELVDEHIHDMTGWLDASELRGRINVNRSLEDIYTGLSPDYISKMTEQFVNDYKNVLDENASNYRSRWGHASDMGYMQNVEQHLKDMSRHIADAMRKANEARDRAVNELTRRMNEIDINQDKIMNKLTEYSDTYRDVARSLRVLSSNIGSAQKIGFRWIDGHLVMVVAAVSLIACLAGATGWRFDDVTHALKPPVTKPLPKASTKA
ncbi:hypothetical protein [Sphingomonas panaciterrae]|uniref:hypothetical protein n=1 Tax=Sphingomonas panaciterrae TaxID=1462999 RepID=UPI002FF22E06